MRIVNFIKLILLLFITASFTPLKVYADISINYKEGLLSLECKEREISSILDILSEKTGRFSYTGQTNEKISIKIENLPLEDALKEIVRGLNIMIVYEYEDGKNEKIRLTLLNTQRDEKKYIKRIEQNKVIYKPEHNEAIYNNQIERDRRDEGNRKNRKSDTENRRHHHM